MEVSQLEFTRALHQFGIELHKRYNEQLEKLVQKKDSQHGNVQKPENTSKIEHQTASISRYV